MPYKSDCPSWLCNEWGVPHDIYYFLGFLLLIAPYALIWRRYFKGIGTISWGSLGCWGLVLVTEITLIVYLLIFMALGMAFNWHFFFVMCYGPFLVICLLLLPTVILTLLVAFLKGKKEEVGKKTNSDNDDLNT